MTSYIGNGCSPSCAIGVLVVFDFVLSFFHMVSLDESGIDL